VDFDARPFQIPLGALIPRRIENLLPACKNIGTTHVTNQKSLRDDGVVLEWPGD
jgi:hypothetical protein